MQYIKVEYGSDFKPSLREPQLHCQISSRNRLYGQECLILEEEDNIENKIQEIKQNILSSFFSYDKVIYGGTPFLSAEGVLECEFWVKWQEISEDEYNNRQWQTVI